jgi:hypothetical protein
MKHGDVENGKDYAWSGTGRRYEAGDRALSRVRILDRTKAYRWHRGEGGQRVITEVGQQPGARMLGRLVTQDGNGLGERILLEPRDLAATWAEHLQAAERREAVREASQAERARNEAERERIDGLLRSAGVQARMVAAGAGHGQWVMDEAGAMALVKRLVAFEARVETLSESLAIAESNAVEA